MAFSPVTNSVLFPCKIKAGETLVVKAFINGEEKASTEMKVGTEGVPSTGLKIAGSVTLYEV